MYSATSLLPQPEATKRHKHQAASVSPSDSSTHLPTKPEAAAVLNDQRNAEKGHRFGNTANQSGDISRPNNEKHLPHLSIPSRSSVPLPENDSDRLKENGDGGGQVDAVLYGVEDPKSHSIGYYCSSDVEKQSEQSYGVYSEEGHGLPQSYPDTAVMNTSDELTVRERNIDQHLRGILLHLSIISPFLTVVLSVYAFTLLAVLSILYPLRYCTSRKPLNQQISEALRPQIYWQLRLIRSNYSASSSAHTRMLIFVSMFSPVYAVGIASASWVAAVFWFYSAILGEPQGANRLDNDGRAAVLGVRGWWERWLVRGAGV
ncbi:hypothetical protein MMC27_002498 [Xylographa pallens]|nr:hypothetical protein [Xylographa pallens]